MKKKTYYPNVTMGEEEYRKLFPDAETAMRYLEKARWSEGIICQICKGMNIHRLPGKLGFHQCNGKGCRKQFNVRTGTIFAQSKIPLNKWFYAIYQMLTSKNGISSVEMSKRLKIT
ncbi:MAG: transposase [Fibromonadales bacterium]|nr:transposase [Fibromonadales bacterium]